MHPGEEPVSVNIPIVPQPDGVNYYFKTWSGRILVVNTLVFIAMVIASESASSLFIPGEEILLKFGAKDLVSIAQGDWWRLITPMFVHIGLIHLMFNSYAIKAIGYQVEFLIGPRWFLFLYFFSGVFGNVCSAIVSPAMSAGASGAILGLLGCGLYVERRIKSRFEFQSGRRARNGIYFINVVGIVILGIVVPNIDNAAHMGGLISGFLIGKAILRIVPNRLVSMNPRKGFVLLSLLGLTFLAGTWAALSPELISLNLERAANRGKSSTERLYYYSKAILLNPSSPDLHFKRGREYILRGELEAARQDLGIALLDPVERKSVEKLRDELRENGLFDRSEFIDRLMREAQFHSL